MSHLFQCRGDEGNMTNMHVHLEHNRPLVSFCVVLIGDSRLHFMFVVLLVVCEVFFYYQRQSLFLIELKLELKNYATVCRNVLDMVY